MYLVYFSPVPWTSFSQRPQKFVQWFHRRFGGDVLWVDPYPGRLPRVGDLIGAASAGGAVESSTPSWLRVVPVDSLPVEPLPLANRINRWLWAGAVAQIESFVLRHRDSLLIGVGKPSRLVLDVIAEHPGLPVLYDAMDDFPSFYAGISRWSMARIESVLVRRADIVWCSSRQLGDRLSSVGAKPRLVPNALDIDMLPEVTSPGAGRAGRRIFGYVGTIGAWFDWSLVLALAELFPDDVVRLVGPLHGPKPVGCPGNIEFLPPCSQRDAIGHMTRFDVGLIPFRQTALTAAVDPVKYYEYRGLGLPVLSTRFGEMAGRGHEAGVFIVSSLGDLVDASRKALGFSASADEILAFRRNNCWDGRFDRGWDGIGPEGE